ncbi:MAG: hypothetical protein Q7T44_01140 [Parvibaculum sp.]|nr:hypothetical protein [Parvibaculum sp.]
MFEKFIDWHWSGWSLAAFFVLMISVLPCLPGSQSTARAQYCPPQEEETQSPKNGSYSYADVVIFLEAKREASEQKTYASEHPCGGGVVCRFLLPPVEKFIVKTFEDPIAAFTLMLTLSTIGLWFATKTAIRKSELSSERQLRAYIFVSKVRLKTKNAANGNISCVELHYENMGETPAKHVTISVQAQITPIGTTVDLTKPPAFESVGSLGPRDKMYDDIIVKDPQNLTVNTFAQLCIRAGTHTVHFWGRIEYEDVFGGRRWTTFYFRDCGNAPFSVDLNAQETGNDYH